MFETYNNVDLFEDTVDDVPVYIIVFSHNILEIRPKISFEPED